MPELLQQLLTWIVPFQILGFFIFIVYKPINRNLAHCLNILVPPICFLVVALIYFFHQSYRSESNMDPFGEMIIVSVFMVGIIANFICSILITSGILLFDKFQNQPSNHPEA